MRRTIHRNFDRSKLQYSEFDISAGIRPKKGNSFNFAAPVVKMARQIDAWTWELPIRVGFKRDALEYPTNKREEPYRSSPYVWLPGDHEGTQIRNNGGYALLYLYHTSTPPMRRIMRKGIRKKVSVQYKSKLPPSEDMMSFFNEEVTDE